MHSQTESRRRGRPFSTEAEFWARMDRQANGCWIWTGARRDGRYGTFKHRHRTDRSHRWAWRFTHGEIPDGLHVLHDCDTPLCCNPAHLHLGTHADNMRERDERGRNKPRTRAGGSTKLSAEQANEIRRRWRGRPNANTGELAREFGVSTEMVWRLGTGRA